MNSIPDTTPSPREPLGPRGFPFLGVLPQMWRDPLGFFVRTGQNYPDVACLKMGSQNVYLAVHPNAVKTVLQENNKNYQKCYETAAPLLGKGLLSNDGESWVRQRKLIQPVFNPKPIEQYANFILPTTEALLERWRPAARAGQMVNVSEEMLRLTLTVIAHAMFSADIHAQTGEFRTAFDDILKYLNARLLSPFQSGWAAPSQRRMQAAIHVLDTYIYGLMTERRRSGIEREDLLSRLLQARIPETGEPLSDQQIRDELMTLFFAGHETTAHSLSWMWYLLAKNPAVESHLLADLDTIFHGETPTNARLDEIPYAMQVFQETLRIYPPLWLFARRAVAEDAVMGVRVPAGQIILLSPYVTQRLPEFWNEPDKFDPDRFTPEKIKERHRFSYFPFSAGPRLCIGFNLAGIEARLVLLRILQEFTLRLPEGSQSRPTPITTLQLYPALRMTLHPRK